MKSIQLINLLLLLLHLSPSTTSSQSTTTTNSIIYDTNGDQLRSHTEYQILPKSGGATTGGLALSRRDYRYPCPPNVVQETESNGLSLKLFPIDKNQTSITTSTDLNLVFMAATTCVQRTGWRMGGVDPFTRRRYVRSDGGVGRPSKETVANWFKIEKYGGGGGGGYKIVYCPGESVCRGCGVVCGDVGLFVESGKRWLGLINADNLNHHNGDHNPLEIVFKKV